MADTGWVTAGAGTNNADAGNTAWANPGNITVATDEAFAGGNVAKNGTTQYLHATDFGFLLPSSVVVDGIEVLTRVARQGNTIETHTIQLIKGGSRAGSNYSTGAAWPTSATNQQYGGSSDLWGLSFTKADIEASNFGLAVRASNPTGNIVAARLYYIQVKVHYTEAASGNPGAFFALFSVKDRLRDILKPKRFWLPEPALA